MGSVVVAAGALRSLGVMSAALVLLALVAARLGHRRSRSAAVAAAQAA
jgi:hypothetical protein